MLRHLSFEYRILYTLHTIVHCSVFKAEIVQNYVISFYFERERTVDNQIMKIGNEFEFESEQNNFAAHFSDCTEIQQMMCLL